MNRTDSPSQSRADEVWRRFVGMFGGDSLERKFGRAPPVEWVAMLGKLNDHQIDRGIRRLAYSGKSNVPTLPEFTRLCRAIGTDDFEEGGSERPALPAPDPFPGDAWDLQANVYLLAHIRQGFFSNARNPKILGNEPALIKAKNSWATDMRDIAVDGKVPPETQKAVWHDYIKRAES